MFCKRPSSGRRRTSSDGKTENIRVHHACRARPCLCDAEQPVFTTSSWNKQTEETFHRPQLNAGGAISPYPTPPTGRGDRQADGGAAGGCFPRTLTCLLALSSARSSSHGPADKHTPPLSLPLPPGINYSRRSQLDLNNSSCECQYLVNNVQKCPTWSPSQLALCLCAGLCYREKTLIYLWSGTYLQPTVTVWSKERGAVGFRGSVMGVWFCIWTFDWSYRSADA